MNPLTSSLAPSRLAWKAMLYRRRSRPGSLRPVEPKGVIPDKEVIAYCRIDERSSHTWFVLRHPPRLPERPQLRRFLDGVGQPRADAEREALTRPASEFPVRPH
jgi:hypothetical protein